MIRKIFLSTGLVLLAVSGANLHAAARQLTGQHAPATTPALKPEEAQKRFVVPEGFEVKLFAAEPDVINPVAMAWDDRGRLWVVELYEYPSGAKEGTKPRDRIRILEDSDGDGRADKAKTFADGFNLATGIQLGNGGVYLGQAPDLIFLEDTNGDDVADKRTVLLNGFGLHDRHELLNGFTWGPDGWMYMTHGVFTHSKVKDPSNPADDGVKMDAAVARFHPRTRKFEVFADGTSNPWGVDFDRAGNAFISACVIDHLFHMAPGGLYSRQGGTPPNPYAYELLPSIVDHKHFRAAYAGINIYQGDNFPESYRGKAFMGNIHQSAINMDTLVPNGSSFKAKSEQDFLVANDGWFRPVSEQTGPDGAIWVMDWYDKYPCYQNANADPEGVDREHGRIWRVVYTGKDEKKPAAQKPFDLKKASTEELVKLLAHSNVWQRRTAQRLLSERRDPKSKDLLIDLLTKGKSADGRIAALWTLHSAEQLDERTLDPLVNDSEVIIRTWVARLTGERGSVVDSAKKRLATLAADKDPSVRLAVATAARQFVSSSLTVNTPPRVPIGEVVTGDILGELMKSSYDGKDPLIPFLYWMALEPIVADDPSHAVEWYPEFGMSKMPLSGMLLSKIMRRVCDLQSPEKFDKTIIALGKLNEEHGPLIVAALKGLLEGQRGKAVAPGKEATEVIARFAKFKATEVSERAQQLATLWGDTAAINASVAKARNGQLSLEERIKSIQALRQIRMDAARDAVLVLIDPENPEPLTQEALRILGEMGGNNNIAERTVSHWKKYSPATRRVAAEVLASRDAWAKILLNTVEDKTILPGEVPTTVVRTLMQSQNTNNRSRAERLIGKFRETDSDKLKLISDKRKVVLAGRPDLQAGREIAKKTCFVCHKLHGEGADVGPDLTGVGRSTLDALLANIIDPNQVIGKGYENVEVETKDGRIVGGRLVEDTDTRVKLISAGPKEDVIAKSEIANQRVSEMSVMPEGLEQMSDEDFRNMIWYILTPPQDNRPMTPDLRKELIGDEAKGAAIDEESVALWNSDWRVIASVFGDTPKKLVEFQGRQNVLVTHPLDESTGAALERKVKVPVARRTSLKAVVGADGEGDWSFRLLVDGKPIHQQRVSKQGWSDVIIDLSAYAGREVMVRVENCANDWEWEYAYWGELSIESVALLTTAK